MIKSKSPAYQEVARRLEALILDGALPPGEKIPSERQLAERLKFSRPLVREALKELRGRGIIETHHGRGSFVAEMVPGNLDNNALLHLLKDHPQMLYDLLDVRELLEGQSAYFAAYKATDEARYRITKAFTAMEDPGSGDGTPEVDAERDHHFHRVISEASRNSVLVHVLQSLSQLLLNSVLASVHNLYHRPEHKARLILHHRRIYNAIMDREPELARDAASMHIREIKASLQEIEREERRLIRADVWSKPD